MSDIVVYDNDSVFSVRSCCIIKNKCGEYLFQKKKEDPKDAWALPGGKVKFNESSLCTVHREMKEEFDLDIENYKLISINEYQTKINSKFYHQVVFIYELDQVVDEINCADSELEFCWFKDIDQSITKPTWLAASIKCTTKIGYLNAMKKC